MEIILGEQKDPSTRESNLSGDTQFARMRAGSSLVRLMATSADLLSSCQGETAYEQFTKLKLSPQMLKKLEHCCLS